MKLISSLHFQNIMASANSKSNTGTKNNSFPCMLHRCLCEIDELADRGMDVMGLKDIFSWQEDGLSFKVHNRKRFQETIMPLFFPRIKHTSFVRQLSLYGFQKCGGSGARRGAMYHELFRRDSPDLAEQIAKVGKRKQADIGQSGVPSLHAASIGATKPASANMAMGSAASTSSLRTVNASLQTSHPLMGNVAALPGSSIATGYSETDVTSRFRGIPPAPAHLQRAASSSVTQDNPHIPYQRSLSRSASEPMGFFFPISEDGTAAQQHGRDNDDFWSRKMPAQRRQNEAMNAHGAPSRQVNALGSRGTSGNAAQPNPFVQNVHPSPAPGWQEEQKNAALDDFLTLFEQSEENDKS